MTLAVGDVLVPVETPAGPAPARVAWADALGQLVVVVEVDSRRGDVAVNVPAEGATYTRTAAAVRESFEPAGEIGEFGRSWAASVTRAATEAARVERAGFAGDEEAYWRRVVAVVSRVLREEAAAS